MIYIRADMNETIATGHMMRCLAIADAVRAMGEEVTFVVADENPLPLLSGREYPAIVLHTDWRDMEGELPVLFALLRKEKPKCLLIDSYQVTEAYLRGLREQVRVCYLDDLNAFDYPVDLLVCYANYYDRFNYSARLKGVELALGPQYAPLRIAFRDCPAKKVKKTAGRLLLMSGGTDPYHVLGRLLERIVQTKRAEAKEAEPETGKDEKAESRGIKAKEAESGTGEAEMAETGGESLMEENAKVWEIDVICGGLNPDYDKLSLQYQEAPHIHIHRQVTDMEQYMQQADLAVSAGGSTLYELCACGTPTISYCIADNQLENVMQFDRDGMIPYAGDMRQEACTERIVELLEQMREDCAGRGEKSRRMQELVDGRGAERIARLLLQQTKGQIRKGRNEI